MANKEELLAQAKEQKIEVPEEATKKEIQALLDKKAAEETPTPTDGSESFEGEDAEPATETTPAEQAAEDVVKSGVQGVTEGSTINSDAGEGEPDAVSEGANDQDQTVSAQAGGIDGVERDHTPAATLDEANSGDAAERIEPPVAANPLSSEASDEAYEANNQVVPGTTSAEIRDAELDENAAKVESHLNEVKEVETELGSSTEEAAAARAGVQSERLNDPKQNREPKNEFEQSNQKVTEVERQAAQEVSDMTTAERTDEAPTPNEAANADAERTAGTNQGSAIADAIVAGLKASDNKNFALQAEPGVEHRFSLVKAKGTGEVMLRENESGTLSKIQLLSLEEKESSIQNTEVEEI